MNLIHEYDQYGRHRIVAVHEDGTVENSDWAAFSAVVRLKPKGSKAEYRAATQFHRGDVPQGVFTCSSVQYSTIGA